MGKKKKVKDKGRKNLNSYITVILLLILGILFAAFVLRNYPVLTGKSVKSSTITAVTPKPSPPIVTTDPKVSNQKKNAAKQTHAIPKSYGRSVNVPILYYHYIGTNGNPNDKARDNLSVAPDKFDEQLDYLAKNGYSVITLDTLYAALKGNAALPPKPIVLTFDDGYIDFYVNAYPILKKYGFHAVSFIPTGLMNQGYYLSWAQIQEMNASGLIAFEAHSVNHPNMAALTPEQVKYQIVQSKIDLEAKIGRTVNFFAYPYGASNEYTWQAVKNAGFVGAVGTWYGNIQSEGNIYDMPRIKIPGGLSIQNFAAKI